MPNSQGSQRRVLVCQNRTCRKQGATQVLAAFQAQPVPEEAPVEVVKSSCLGQCGNGPMVLIEPDEVWYCRVHPEEVPSVVVRHLQEGRPVRGMMYPKYHK